MKNKSREKRKRAREHRKHRSLKEMLRDRRSLLTDTEVFTSAQMTNYIRGKVKIATNEFGRRIIRTKIIFEPFNDTAAVTDNTKILVNAGHPIFSGTREERFRLILGAVAHEISHYLFTNFTAMEEWINGLSKGLILPTVPQYNGTDEKDKKQYEENSIRIQEFLDGKIGCTKSTDPSFTNREWIVRAGKNLLNILEDGRVENIFSMFCTKFRSLYYGLIELISKQRASCNTLPEILTRVDSGELFEYEAIRCIILHYVRFGEIKGYVHKEHKDEPIVVAITKVIPYIDEYIDSMDSYTSYNNLNRIMITLWPYFEKMVNHINDNLDTEGVSQDYGPSRMTLRSACIPGETESPSSEGEGTDSESFNRSKPGANKNPCPSPSAKRSSAEDSKEESAASDTTEPSENSKSSEDSETSEGSEASTNNDSTSEETEESTDSGTSNNTSTENSDSDEDDATLEDCSNSTDDEESKEQASSGSSDNSETEEDDSTIDTSGDSSNEENSDEDVSGSNENIEAEEVNVDRSKRSGEHARMEGINRINDILDAVRSEDKECESEIEIEEETNAELDLRNLMDELAGAMSDELEKREYEEDFRSLDSSIDYGKIHDGITCSFLRHKVTDSNRREYLANKNIVDKLVNDMIRKSTFLQQEEDPLEFKNKYSGRRFNASATAKNDYRYFSREAHIEPNYELDVIILCDESGSMSGTRIEACKATSLCCYEFMKQACGPGHVSVYGHSTGRMGYSGMEGHVNLYCYADFDEPDEEDKYRIMNMSAGGSNRDGYALRFVKEMIAERDAERKLIITISDGQPADISYYGTNAVKDIQSILRECQRENIMYIAAAIGSDQEVIKEIYGGKHFLNLANLEELPRSLMGLISKLLK